MSDPKQEADPNQDADGVATSPEPDASSELPAMLDSPGRHAESAAAPVEPPLAEPPEPTKVNWWRMGALVLLTIVLFAVGHATGVTEYLTRDRVRELVGGLGAMGVLLYVALFALGELVHVPGLVFVTAAIVAWGPVGGFAASFVGAVTSVTFSFVVVRAVGGQPLGALKRRPFFAKVLARLEGRPIQTVAALRTFLWMAPGLNYALAMSTLKLRDYVVGSALGLIAPLLLAAFALEWFLDLISGLWA